MTNNRVPLIDRWIWVIVILLAATAAFAMMKRDAARKFGAVSYGMFPQFEMKDQHGRKFDFHNLKGHAWAVRFSSHLDQELIPQLEQIVKGTAMADKRLYVLTFSSDSNALIDDAFHYTISGTSEELSAIRQRLGFPNDTAIVLIDQTSAIRGVYNLEDVDDSHRLHQNLLGLL